MPKNKSPLVSVIVPVYNVEAYIENCIQSIVYQTYSNFEIIIVNDGTKDQSIQRIQHFLDKYDNIHLINQENQGLSAARNTGLDHAKGEYIAFVDSDDKVRPRYLENMVNLALETNAEIVRGSFKDFNNKPVDGWISDFETKPVTGQTGLSLFLKQRVSFVVWSSLYKKSLIDQHNLRFMPGILLEDGDFTTRAYLYAKTIVAKNFYDYQYQIRPGSILTSANYQRMSDSEELVIAKFLDMDKRLFEPKIIDRAILGFMRDWTRILAKSNTKPKNQDVFDKALIRIDDVLSENPIDAIIKFKLKVVAIKLRRLLPTF